VRFYERKEIKDALAYLKLLLNPHDDVSLRRIINVPARGSAKAVLDALEQARGAFREPASPKPAGRPFGEGGKPEARSQKPEGQDADIHNTRCNSTRRIPNPNPEPDPERLSLWTALDRRPGSKRFPARAAASLGAFRDLILSLSEMSRREPASAAIAKVLDQSGYLQESARGAQRRGRGPHREPRELVSAAREYEGREAEPRWRLCRPALAAFRGGRIGGAE